MNQSTVNYCITLQPCIKNIVQTSKHFTNKYLQVEDPHTKLYHSQPLSRSLQTACNMTALHVCVKSQPPAVEIANNWQIACVATTFPFILSSLQCPLSLTWGVTRDWRKAMRKRHWDKPHVHTVAKRHPSGVQHNFTQNRNTVQTAKSILNRHTQTETEGSCSQAMPRKRPKQSIIHYKFNFKHLCRSWIKSKCNFFILNSTSLLRAFRCSGDTAQAALSWNFLRTAKFLATGVKQEKLNMLYTEFSTSCQYFRV